MDIPLKQPEIADDKLRLAIEECAQEPIHVPDAIQPHGYMIVTDNAFNIQKISENLLTAFNKDPKSIFNQPLETLLNEKIVSELKKIAAEDTLNTLHCTEVSLEVNHTFFNYDVIIHQPGDFKVIELEPHQQNTSSLEKDDFYQEIVKLSIEMQKISTPVILYQYLVNQIRRITGFARVKLYAFDENWNGTVVAEDKEDTMPSYLGLSFPHTDIPKQARQLYTKNYLRIIPNTDYEPAALIQNDKYQDEQTIDLTFSVLRHVSPIHLQYLQNMGVKSSMSISVLQNGKLWGLIACHHHKPHQIPYSTRMLAELLTHNFSTFLSSTMNKEALAEQSRKESLIKKLYAYLTKNDSLIKLLETQHSLILESLDADGFLIHLDGEFFTFGNTPEISQAENLVNWLENNYNEKIFTSRSIAQTYGLEASEKNTITGVFTTPVSKHMKDYIIWFREEKSTQINWAGKPEKTLIPNKTGFSLTPRTSFERWKEHIHGFSKPWTEIDSRIGMEISQILFSKGYRSILQEKRETEKLLLQSNKELERMAYIASHDFQEPLRMIFSFTELLQIKHKADWDEDTNRYVNFILSSSQRMYQLLASGYIPKPPDTASYIAAAKAIENFWFKTNRLASQV